MKTLLLALAFLAASIAPLEAVTTAKFTLTNASWTDLGAGPLLLNFRGDGAFAVGDVTPTLPIGEGFSIPANASYRVETASHVWGASKSNLGVTAYVSAY